jgi:hypothetical protein
MVTSRLDARITAQRRGPNTSKPGPPPLGATRPDASAINPSATSAPSGIVGAELIEALGGGRGFKFSDWPIFKSLKSLWASLKSLWAFTQSGMKLRSSMSE